MLSFDNHSDGFVYGPKLFVTHDGGVTWTPQAQPGTVLSVEALGYSVWMLEADCPAGTTTGGVVCPLRLLESSDGGHSWKPSPTQPPGAVAKATALKSEPAQGQSWFIRVSTSAAYIVSTPGSSPDGSPTSAGLWYTADSGSTWTAGAVPCGFQALSVMLSAAPDGSLTAVCAWEPSAGFQPKSTAVSQDGGRTWVTHNPCPGPLIPQCANSVPSPLDSGYLGAIDSISATTTFLVGGRTQLLVTRDGGKTWQPVIPRVGGSGENTDQVIFFDSHDGVVLGTDSNIGQALWTTTDGGATWSEIVPTIS